MHLLFTPFTLICWDNFGVIYYIFVYVYLCFIYIKEGMQMKHI